MGYMVRHSVIVVGPQRDLHVFKFGIEDVWGNVLRLAEKHTCTTLVSPVMPSLINREGAFFIAPDGSKEGWSHSDVGDEFRDAVIHYLEKLREKDRSTCFKWVEVQFADDEGVSKVTRHSEAEE